MTNLLRRIDRPWSNCPTGTKAYASNGGYWIKTANGRWQWPGGSSFPTPGGDAYRVMLPPVEAAQTMLGKELDS